MTAPIANPSATAPATAGVVAEPPINDALPEGGEIVSDADLTSVLSHFYPGGEMPAGDDAPPTPAAAEAPPPVAAVDPDAAAPIGDAPPETPVVEEQPPGPLSFSPEQTADVERRLTEALGPVQDELAVERARAETLEGKLAAVTNPAPLPPGIHPLLITDDLADVEKRQRAVDAFIEWADEHPGGYEAQKEGEQSWSAEQVRKVARQMEREDAKLLPQARALIAERADRRKVARVHYPALFDPKSAEYRIRQGLHARAPWLKAVFPQFDLWLGHMIAGEKVFNARAKGKPQPGAPAKPLTRPITPSPGAGAPAGGPKPPKRNVNEMDADEFAKRGADRNALVAMIQESY